MKFNFGCSKFSGRNINYNQFPSDASKFIYEMFSKQLDGVTSKTGKTREIQLKYLWNGPMNWMWMNGCVCVLPAAKRYNDDDDNNNNDTTNYRLNLSHQQHQQQQMRVFFNSLEKKEVLAAKHIVWTHQSENKCWNFWWNIYILMRMISSSPPHSSLLKWAARQEIISAWRECDKIVVSFCVTNCKVFSTTNYNNAVCYQLKEVKLTLWLTISFECNLANWQRYFLVREHPFFLVNNFEIAHENRK